MKTKVIFLCFFTAAVLLTISGCKKGAGEGGKGSIHGKITSISYSYSKTLAHFVYNATYPGQGENVYIIYGSNITYNNSVKTNYDGTFEFPFLRPGDYTVYAYSKDTVKYFNGVPDQSFGAPITNKTTVVIAKLSISGKKDAVDAGEIKILK